VASLPVDRALGVRDRTHPDRVEYGQEPGAVGGGSGILDQRRADPVGERGGRALEQQRPGAPEQVG
jgi:hypothetical protein